MESDISVFRNKSEPEISIREESIKRLESKMMTLRKTITAMIEKYGKLEQEYEKTYIENKSLESQLDSLKSSDLKGNTAPQDQIIKISNEVESPGPTLKANIAMLLVLLGNVEAGINRRPCDWKQKIITNSISHVKINQQVN